MMQSRKRMFLVVIAIAVLFGAGGYALGQRLESPEDARAEVAAPEPSLIAVPIEAVALSNDVVLRGDAEFEGAIDLELDATLGDGASRVVTGRVPDVDSLVEEGDVIIEVSGRPVFVLGGDLPGFREFKPGLEGDDVLQLETALQRLGFLEVEPDKLYGSATESAIEAMYEAAGYDAPAAREGEETQLDAARDLVKARSEALANANDALSDALKPKTASQLQTERTTRRDLLKAIEDAEDALDFTEKNTPSNALLNLITDMTTAQMLGEDTSPFEQRLAQQEQADEQAVEDAKEAVVLRKQALEDFEAGLVAAEQDRDTSNLQDQISRSSEDLSEAEADLAELEEEIGVRLPVAEVVFLADLPRTVTAIDIKRGDFVAGPVMRISGTEVRITSGVSEANRPLLEIGQKVVIDSAALGVELEGEITELADRTGTNGVADTRYYMQVTPTGDYKVTELVGINFRLKIPLEKSEGEVLAVPLAALSQGADGSSRVELLTGDDTSELVLVTVGLQDKNRSLVEVESLGRDLSAGDLVVIGLDIPETVEVPADDAADEPASDESEPAEDDGGS